MQEVKAPIIGIDRHRLTTDGKGVTTLVAFHGCPLHCKYCLNPQCLSPDGVLRTITPSELYSEIEIDDLYFVAIGGAFALVVASLYCTANSLLSLQNNES